MITLLIPTINRSAFIIKYLKYLIEYNFKGEVLIGDSSDKIEFIRTRNFINQSKPNFKVGHYEYPDLTNSMCIKNMLPKVNTPFCMFICDDDIIIVETLGKCMEHLNNNPDYSACGGKAIACYLSEDNLDNILHTGEYSVKEINENKSSERVTKLMNNFSVVGYSVSRTEDFIKRWPESSKLVDKKHIKDNVLVTETLPCLCCAAQGKIKILDDLFVVRQLHYKRNLIPTFDTIIKSHWPGNICFVLEYVAKIVSELDSISFDESYSIVKEACKNYYIRPNFEKKFKNNSLLNNIDLRSAIKAIPGSKEVALWLRSILCRFVSNYDYILPILLNPSSRYHKDFMPVYKVISNQSVINQ